jgi:hypothetical protein
MFKRKPKKVYVVTGITYELDAWAEDHAYPVFPTRMVFSSYHKALKFIKEIIEDVRNEAKEMEYKIVKCEFKKEFNTLEIEFETGTVENWVINEREVL